jgi:hypothetical protein
MTRSQCSQCGKFNPADIHTCPTTEERFWAKVAKSEDCWLWTAAKFDNGYGAFWLNGRQMRAHRYSFELAGGERRPDQILDHKCHTKACVRPDHLRAVSHRENSMDFGVSAINARKTHCPRGHAYTGLDINGRRVCRICSRAWDREYRKRRKAA